MKISIEKIKMNIILWYPFINLFICYVFRGDMMNIFSILVCGILLFLSFNKIRNNISMLFLIIILFITVCTSFLRENNISGIVSSLTYSITVFFFLIYSDKNISISKIKEFFLLKATTFFAMQLMFFLLLVVYVYKFGLTAGWDTYVLQGPYLYPHTLAYILLFVLMVDCYIWLESRKSFAIVFAGLCAICIVLTAVRSVLISLMITLIYLLYKLMDYKKFKKFLFCLSVGGVALIIAYKMGAFDIVIHKTYLAIANSTITNGRGKIAVSSLKALGGKYLIVKCFLGVGMDALQLNNQIFLGANIHAHNDLIDVLVCYGLINLFIYIFYFYSFSKNNILWYVGSLGVLILFNGLFPYIDCIPILIYAKILFENSPRKDLNI